MAIANFTPLPTLPTPPNTQTDTKPIFLQKADAFNPALKGWADNFNSGTVPTLNDLIALLNQQLPYINTVADSDKAIRAIYADLSSIISVSEGIDSVQTVAEQISGVKDIADNLTEVLAAKGYAEDAKKWALIAESVANIGPATPEKIGLVKPDAVTTHITEDGTISAKDVAIGGNLEDLASARGQVGDARQLADLDFNMLTVPGFYRTTGNPKNGPIGISGASIGSLFVSGMQGNGNRLFQIMVSGNGIYWRTSISGGTTWEIWNQVLTGNKIGDGIRNTNGIISVPEMQGATASTAGTSGLVPPASAGQHESFLTGGGEYKPALTKISDSVNLADSKTAASAKAVKTAYDLANSKQANLGFTPVQQGGGAGQEGQKIYIGWSPSGLKAQADVLDLGNVVTTSAGCTKAPSATTADLATTATRLRLTGGVDTSWAYAGKGGQPAFVWGSDNGVNMDVWSPLNFNVASANISGQAQLAAPAVQWVVNLSGPAITVPPGGTYNVVCIVFNDSGGKGAVKYYPGTAGGTVISNAPTDYFVAGLCARVA